MKVDEFYEILAATKHRWRIESCTGEINAFMKGGRICCPITAVCEATTNRKYSIGQYDEAAKDMGLPQHITNRIVQAADNWDMGTDHRRRILKAVNLKDPS